jgi:hypothetical protein
MLEPIPFAGMVEIDESFDRTVNHMAGEYAPYNEQVDLINAGYEKFTREELLKRVRQQEVEIESLLVQLESLHKFIIERGETRALIIWKAQGK